MRRTEISGGAMEAGREWENLGHSDPSTKSFCQLLSYAEAFCSGSHYFFVTLGWFYAPVKGFWVTQPHRPKAFANSSAPCSSQRFLQLWVG